MISVVFEDEFLIAVSKPAGLLMHPSVVDPHEKRSLTSELKQQLGYRCLPLHRLDRATSGVVLLAKTPDMARHMGQLWQAGQVTKTYLAVVRGYPKVVGEIDHPLGPVKDERAAKRGGGLAQPAQSRYRRLATIELPVLVDKYPQTRYALVALQPLTGRRHQLRRHMKHLSHPLIGDVRYGKGTHNRFFQQEWGCERLLLHAYCLEFMHPIHQRSQRVIAPVEGVFAEVLRRFAWPEHDFSTDFEQIIPIESASGP